MTVCPKCYKELNDNAKFCDNCGTRIFKKIDCPECGKQTSTEFTFCQSCGFSLTEQTKTEQTTAEITADEQTIAKQATADQKTVEQTTAKQATADQNTVEQTTAKQATTEQSVNMQAIADQASIKHTASEHTATEHTATGHTASEQSAAEQNAVKQTGAKQAATGQNTTEQSVVKQAGAEQTGVASGEKKSNSKKVILFGGIGVAIVVVLILIVSLFSAGGRRIDKTYALYLKDKEIYFKDLKLDGKAWQLTNRLLDSDDVADDDDLAEAKYLGYNTYMSKNGRYIFFPDKIAAGNNNFSLYYKDVTKPDSDAIKIDSGITEYSVNTSNTIVTYYKIDDGTLYQYNISKDSKEKIAGEVKDSRVSDDGNKIYYINYDNNLYFKDKNKDKEKLASDVTGFQYVTENFSTVYYIKEGALYKQAVGSDKVKIASDVFSVINIYDSGEIYYLADSKIALIDYITDDMKDVDAAINKPEYPAYPDAPAWVYWWEYTTDAEYQAAYNKYEEAYSTWEEEYNRIANEYNVANEAYAEKQKRDELRYELQNLDKEALEPSCYSLCFYNGTETNVITDAFTYYNDLGGYSGAAFASDAPVIVYGAFDLSEVEKVKISEVESIYDITLNVPIKVNSTYERYIAVEADTKVVEQKRASNFRINSSGTVVYYIDNIPDEKNYGELFSISVSGGVVGKAKLYDSDVYNGFCGFISDGEFEYFKDYKNYKGDLYINKKRIDYDVDVFSIEAYPELGKVMYLTDWNDDKYYGTLKVYDGEKSVKISDDVHDYIVASDGRVLYLYDYSYKYYKGELYEWYNGEKRKIDDDVICILIYFDNRFKNLVYNW